MSQPCNIDSSVLESFKKFRFKKLQDDTKLDCLILKIVADKLLVVKDSEFDGISLDDLKEELPDTSPRFILLTFQHTHLDGRISNPLVGINYSPRESSMDDKMLYSWAKTTVFNAADIRGKIFELHEIEDLDEEWLTTQVTGSKTRQ
ncbi:hypothetical protein HDU92_001759 [Lobulomyces angularis]|nr:hypothetical protein HDU92_001759 [Lobulomyces angularis]